MKRFIEGEDRSQVTLLPECLDDFIGEDNPVRVVDVFVDELDLLQAWLRWRRAGSDRAPVVPPGGAAQDLHLRLPQPHPVEPPAGDRDPAQPRADVADRALGARLQDHRRLPARQRRRRSARSAASSSCCAGGCACSAMASWPSTAASSRRSTTATRTSPTASCRRGCEQLEQSIERYLVELDRADRQAATVLPTRVAHLKDKIAKVREQMKNLHAVGERLEASEDRQVSLTDPDARSMATSGRGTGIVGYNVQTAVDAKHHMIVAHEVTNVGHDREPWCTWPSSLAGTGHATDRAGRSRLLRRLRDPECERRHRRGAPAASLQQRGRGALRSRDFVYDPEREYRCPAGQIAIRRFTRRGRKGAAQVLALGLSAVPDQGAVHDSGVQAHHALGARGGA